MQFSKQNTALVVIDPQNDVLSEKGVSWALVGDSVKENNTVANIERLFIAAKEQDFGVFISPHYLYPFDQAWQFGGAVENSMLDGKEFFRPIRLVSTGFPAPGPTGSSVTSRSSRTARRSWSALTKLGPSKQRSGPATSQAPYRQGHPGGDVGQPLRREPPARIAGAGFRGRRGEGRDGRSAASRSGDGYKAAIVNYGFLPMRSCRRTKLLS